MAITVSRMLSYLLLGLESVLKFAAHLCEILQIRLRNKADSEATTSAQRLVIVDQMSSGVGLARILKSGPAQRIIFFYPGEEGTYIDNVFASLYDNGIVQLRSGTEETTTHLRNCEILWRFQTEEDRASKIRLLKPKAEARKTEDSPELTLAVVPQDPGTNTVPILNTTHSSDFHPSPGDGK